MSASTDKIQSSGQSSCHPSGMKGMKQGDNQKDSHTALQKPEKTHSDFQA